MINPDNHEAHHDGETKENKHSNRYYTIGEVFKCAAKLAICLRVSYRSLDEPLLIYLVNDVGTGGKDTEQDQRVDTQLDNASSLPECEDQDAVEQRVNDYQSYLRCKGIYKWRVLVQNLEHSRLLFKDSPNINGHKDTAAVAILRVVAGIFSVIIVVFWLLLLLIGSLRSFRPLLLLHPSVINRSVRHVRFRGVSGSSVGCRVYGSLQRLADRLRGKKRRRSPVLRILNLANSAGAHEAVELQLG